MRAACCRRPADGCAPASASAQPPCRRTAGRHPRQRRSLTDERQPTPAGRGRGSALRRERHQRCRAGRPASGSRWRRRWSLRQAVEQLSVLGADSVDRAGQPLLPTRRVLADRLAGDLLHRAPFLLSSSPQGLGLVVAQPQVHRHGLTVPLRYQRYSAVSGAAVFLAVVFFAVVFLAPGRVDALRGVVVLAGTEAVASGTASVTGVASAGYTGSGLAAGRWMV